MKDYKREIEDYIIEHKEEMLNDIFELIKIDSSYAEDDPKLPYGSGPDKALEKVLAIAGNYGFKGVNYDHQVAVIDLNDKPRFLDMPAHMDVVPAGEGWSVTRPFEPIIKDGYIYGRGSSDDKGPAMAALYAMRAVKDLEIPLTKNAKLILGADEECGGEDLDYYYDREGYPTWAFSPDGDFPVVNVEKGFFSGEFHIKDQERYAAKNCETDVICIRVGEASNMIPGKADATIIGIGKEELASRLEKIKIDGISLEADQNQDGSATLIVKGNGGHASEPERCSNALTALSKVLNEIQLPECSWTIVGKTLEELFPHGAWNGSALGVDMEDDISGPLTMSLNMLEYSPGKLKGVFDSRIPLCANRENLEEPVRRILCERGLELSEDSTLSKPHHVPEDSELVQALLRSYSRAFGEPGHCKYSGGGSYLHGLKFGVVFGCEFADDPTNMHGPDEHVKVDTLINSAVAFALAIVELCS